jgi:hypothetical protein
MNSRNYLIMIASLFGLASCSNYGLGTLSNNLDTEDLVVVIGDPDPEVGPPANQPIAPVVGGVGGGGGGSSSGGGGAAMPPPTIIVVDGSSPVVPPPAESISPTTPPPLPEMVVITGSNGAPVQSEMPSESTEALPAPSEVPAPEMSSQPEQTTVPGEVIVTSSDSGNTDSEDEAATTEEEKSVVEVPIVQVVAGDESGNEYCKKDEKDEDSDDDKLLICHRDHSNDNGHELLVSRNAWFNKSGDEKGHADHDDDNLGACANVSVARSAHSTLFSIFGAGHSDNRNKNIKSCRYRKCTQGDDQAGRRQGGDGD